MKPGSGRAFFIAIPNKINLLPINTCLTKKIYYLQKYKGFFMEPNMHQIDDFNDKETPQKRKIVLQVVLGILILSAVIQGFKEYFDRNMPESFNPVVQK